MPSVHSSTVVASPVTNEEVVVARIPAGVPIGQIGDECDLIGSVDVTLDAVGPTTALTTRIRHGVDTTGALLCEYTRSVAAAVSPRQTMTVQAAARGTDTGYVLTIQATGATAASTTNAVFLRALFVP